MKRLKSRRSLFLRCLRMDRDSDSHGFLGTMSGPQIRVFFGHNARFTIYNPFSRQNVALRLSHPPSYRFLLFLVDYMFSSASLVTFVALASSVWAAPAESCPQGPTIKSQVTAYGKQYYYRGCYDELKRE